MLQRTAIPKNHWCLQNNAINETKRNRQMKRHFIFSSFFVCRVYNDQRNFRGKTLCVVWQNVRNGQKRIGYGTWTLEEHGLSMGEKEYLDNVNSYIYIDEKTKTL